MKYTLLILLVSANLWSADGWRPKGTFNKIECQIRQLPQKRLRHVPIAPGVSANWSGYVAASNLKTPALFSVESVAGTWNVPVLVSPNTNGTYSAVWVGIDGYTDTTVQQIGTEHDWVNGSQQNYAWFEMYPQGSYEIVGFPLTPNDQISAQVLFQAPSTFILTLWNHTENVYAEVPTEYTRTRSALRRCAEWIIEAPSNGSSILPLTDFKTIAFTNCFATIQNKTGTIGQNLWPLLQLNMETTSGVLRAMTSALEGNAFTVNWEHQ